MNNIQAALLISLNIWSGKNYYRYFHLIRSRRVLAVPTVSKCDEILISFVLFKPMKSLKASY